MVALMANWTFSARLLSLLEVLACHSDRQYAAYISSELQFGFRVSVMKYC